MNNLVKFSGKVIVQSVKCFNLTCPELALVDLAAGEGHHVEVSAAVLLHDLDHTHLQCKLHFMKSLIYLNYIRFYNL